MTGSSSFKIFYLFAIMVVLTPFIVITGADGIKKADAASASSPGNIIEKFKSPDVDAKPMARTWFPDGGAGSSNEGLAMVAKQIKDMADGGMGGVEIAYISDATEYDNAEAKEIGWATENWRRLLKEVLKTANAVKEGFKVDITITAHWPPVANNLDPNDDAASSEASYAYKKITTKDLADGKIDLPLPVQKKRDYASFYGKGDATASFLFVDKFAAATILKVTGLDRQGKPVFELASAQDVSAATKRKTTTDRSAGRTENGILYAGYSAGVPGRDYCAANGLKYEDTVAAFGPEPNDPDLRGKIDQDGNRKRMADWQYLYETDISSPKNLTASEGNDLKAGDYVIFGSYYRGTGQVLSGGGSVVMYNRCYATDYFSDIGIQKVFDVWRDHILDDEMIALLKENGKKNGTSIFEDSIEIHKSGAAWTYDLLDEFKKYNGYSAVKYAPLLAMGSANSFDNRTEASRILEDYNQTMGSLYADEHASLIRKWAAEFNYTYRAQGYGLTGLDMCGAALALDIPEGDNGTSGDGVRQLSAAVSMKGGKMLSNESTTFSANINSKWSKVMKELHADFSYGVNRSILHGSPFSRTFNGYYSAWPGWNFGRYAYMEGLNGSGFSSWNGRQIYWGDVDTATNYIARVQAVMQNGQAKVDLAVLLGANGGFGGRGNSMQTLMNRGYSYHMMTEPVIKLDNANVKNGVLAPDGPGYRALIIAHATKMSVAGLEKVIGFAKSGLPVILFNTDIGSVQGTNKSANNDDTVKARFVELSGMKNVYKAKTQEEILSILGKNGVDPAASFDQSGLEATHRESKEGDYYYLFNNKGKESMEPPGSGEIPEGVMPGGPEEEGGTLGGAPGSGRGEASGPGGNAPGGAPGEAGGVVGGGRGAAGASVAPDTAALDSGALEDAAESVRTENWISTSVSLKGDGIPYILDAWTGEIIPVAQYKTENGRIKLDIELRKRDAMIICIAKDMSQFPAAAKSSVTGLTGGKVVYDNGRLVHRADAAGKYIVNFNDSRKKTITVDRVPDTISLTKGWDIKLESWGPSAAAENLSKEKNVGYELDPSVSEKKTIEIKGIDLDIWNKLPVTDLQLSALGVAGMDIVSGIGRYSTTFVLPKNWTSDTGAYMRFEHSSDMIVEVRINGKLIDDINQMTDTTDVGSYLKEGENTLEIKLDSTLQNRDSSAKEKTTYGLKNVLLIPYVQSEL